MFIKCHAEFRNPELSDAEWDMLSDKDKRENIQMRKMRFDPQQVQTYNTHWTPNKSTLWFKSNETWVVDMTVEQLDKIMDGLQNKAQLINKN